LIFSFEDIFISLDENILHKDRLKSDSIFKDKQEEFKLVRRDYRLKIKYKTS
jgi:hypothetical protein